MYCKMCINRKLDTKQGIICKLTGRKAEFENECREFKRDPALEHLTNESGALDSDLVLLNSGNQKMMLKLAEEENYPFALIAGIITGFVGAVAWAMITVATNVQFGYMAVAIGAGVGYVMKLAGKGVTNRFRITGAVIALLSCIMGNFFTIIMVISKAQGIGIFEILLTIDYAMVPSFMLENSDLFDVLFYGIAVAEGFKFSALNEQEKSRNIKSFLNKK